MSPPTQRGQGQWALGYHEPLKATELLKKDVAKEPGRDLADITDRQKVQFHWIRIEDVPGRLTDRADEEQFASRARRAGERLLA